MIAQNFAVQIEGEAVLRCSIYGESSDPLIAFVKLLMGFEGSDGSTTFIDESPAARTISVLGDAQIDTAQKKFGSSSGLFDGTGDGVGPSDHADFDLPAAWTFECFIRFNSVAGDQAIFGGGWNPPNDGYLFRYTSNTLEWFCHGGTNLTGSAWSPSTGVWYHVAIDRDGTTTRIYVDGVMIGSTTGVQAGVPTQGFTIGAQNRIDGGRPFNGCIDEFRYTRGFARYGSGSGFTPPTTAFPRS